MREILFRGKSVESNRWYYGFYWKTPTTNKHYIMHWDKDLEKRFDEEVIPETVGQFTGVTDTNGVRIFEGIVILQNFVR